MHDRSLILLFDGDCALCDRAVDFVIRRDRRARFRFAPLQSPAGLALRAALDPAPATAATAGDRAPGPGETMVLLDGDRAYTRSTAALRILRALGPPWSAAYPLILVPAPLRDAVYAFIAARRYRWFGRRDVCRLPTAAERARML